ncbi:putative rho GTPase-activating protein 4-like [Scophthalmus maximus]|uniref:Putative rho GTPase-activating protein 4-like n=2 Tax=Scophthalmus maximus TaxID=52904 RepID=A0A2U9BZ95_SCOMX|nr:rho GTPase-activating protein 4 isoform X3 [Scophthalmus maximus]AWP09647.1 putative rho GTPase-activating protein 4-like [Scophthalmus maximus]
MTSHVKLWKDRVGLVDYDTQIKEVRCQLADQLKVLDLQLEQKSQQLQDLTDYLRRRGEIENEYARSLDKLAERFTSRIKRKEPSSHSVAKVWLALLSQTRQESRDHNGLSESCSNFLIQPLTHCLEYTQRLAKKSKDICSQLQDGLLKVTTELQTAWRTYYQYHSDYVCAEGKLKEAEKQEEKQKQSAAKKLERLIEKRQGKVQEINLKCIKARNDYLINLGAANASMNKYYFQDISTLIDCADVGYHQTLSRVMQAYLSRRWRTQKNLSTGLQQLQGVVSGLEQSQDRDLLLRDNYNSFSLPLRFTYQPHDGDQVSEVSGECEMRCELETRLKQIQTRLKAVTLETEEASKNMSAAQCSLLESVADDDLEPGGGGSCLDDGTENQTVKPSVARRRANLQEMENLYITRVKEYLVGSSLVSKLQAKHDLLKVAVEKAEVSNEYQPRHNGKSMRVRKNHSSTSLMHNHKLFSGDMLSFLQASGQQIPIVVESCIRFINLNGLHHEGIFRVPGSQMEVNNLRDAFERGEDPLAEQRYDLDSVAGVLKLYFRVLENPLFPIDSTDQLLEYAQIINEAERAAQLKMVISSYPEPVIIVMRYLFAFLHHVSQYSDENMMQPYNLAVCFGPSLVRGARDDDVVTLQAQINSLVKSIILQHESIYPNQSEVQGPVYEKCMTQEQDDCEPLLEEGDVDAEYTHGKDEVEKMSSADSSTGMSAGQTRAERPRANSSGSIDQTRLTCGPAGGSITSGGKLMLQIPIGPQFKARRAPSPGLVRRDLQESSSSEDIRVQVDKEVCRQMDSVFKELLSRQALQDPSSTASSPSVQAPQRKGKRDGRRGRGVGLFKAVDPLD